MKTYISILLLFTGLYCSAQNTTSLSGHDHVQVRLVASTAPKQTKVEFEFNFVDTDPKDIAKVEFIMLVDRSRYNVKNIDFGEFKKNKCTVKKTVYHNGATDVGRFTIALPNNHGLPPTSIVGAELIDFFGANSSNPYYVTQILEPSITLTDGSVRHLKYNEIIK